MQQTVLILEARKEVGEALQAVIASANLVAVVVPHLERMSDLPMEQRRLNACVDSGFIGENVYLFCASEGLATVFLGAVDAAKLAHALELPDEQFVAYAQTVGFPA